jgi:hypothetical protein
LPEIVPDFLRDAYDQLTESVADLDTAIARAHETPVPSLEPADPEQLAEAARSADAPRELRAVATAVAEGRITWAEVATGGGRDLPEIRELHAVSADRLATELAAALAEERAAKPAVRPAPRDEDFPPLSTLHDAW